MKERLKYPLSIYVVWHPLFDEGEKFANEIYSHFCRNVKNPLERALGIPVYFRSAVNEDDKPVPIEINKATKNAIVLLVDQNYLIDESFKAYTKELRELVDEESRIYPIQLCEEAYALGCGINEYQFTRAFYGDLKKKKNYKTSSQIIRTELLNNLARLLLGLKSTWNDEEKDRPNSPVKLFLSHAKKDGVETTTKFKRFVEENLKLDVFFDTFDIADGYNFKNQIEQNIENSALVVFLTDEYSTREWCKIEVLTAKRRKSSIVVVHKLKKGERRAFPYLGNVPTVVAPRNEEDVFAEIVDKTLFQVLNNVYQRKLLTNFSSLFEKADTDFIILSSPPELFNYLDIYKKKRSSRKKVIVLYPEPPLGNEELKVLNDVDEEIKFITPIQLPTL
ncbi:MAG: toll/interleukin-1 receptor domain-containing protein [Candidatus Paceibacterota bacterium]